MHPHGAHVSLMGHALFRSSVLESELYFCLLLESVLLEGPVVPRAAGLTKMFRAGNAVAAGDWERGWFSKLEQT